jgi:hypothetical protein
MWHRWQKRATSRTAAPHFGQGIVACGTGAAVGSQEFAGPGDLSGVAVARAGAGRASELGGEDAGVPVFVSGFALPGSDFAESATSEATLGALPSPFPGVELVVIPHLSGDAGAIRALP